MNKINDKYNFRDRDVKVLLLNQFGSEIDFTNHRAANKSMMVFRAPSTLLAILKVDSVVIQSVLDQSTTHIYWVNRPTMFS